MLGRLAGGNDSYPILSLREDHEKQSTQSIVANKDLAPLATGVVRVYRTRLSGHQIG